jgi:hypothetical protein
MYEANCGNNIRRKGNSDTHFAHWLRTVICDFTFKHNRLLEKTARRIRMAVLLAC